MQLHRIAHQFFNRPLLLQRASAEAISGFLLSRIGAGGALSLGEDDSGESRQSFRPTQKEDGSYEFHSPRASRFYGDYPVDPNSNGKPKPYRRTPDGKALITSVGEFVNRGAYVGASSGLISYEGFKYQMLTAAGDDRVNHIINDQETPGGEAVGAFEAADVVRQVAAIKPVTTVVNGMSCSAGYAIASASTNIVTIPTGIVGSIGVVMLHLDFSKFLEEEGIKPTFIFAGDHKVDGNPYEALPDEVRARFAAEIDSFYQQFVQTVAAGRKNLTPDAIKATQAGVFKGQDAVDAGLADEVGTFEDVLAQKPPSIARARASSKGTKMITQEDHDAALALARTESHALGKTEGVKEGAAAETVRINTILGSEKVKGKKKSALQIATAMPDATADKVIEIVAALPEAASSAATIADRTHGQGALLALGNPPLKSGSSADASAGWDAAAAAVNKQYGVAAK